MTTDAYLAILRQRFPGVVLRDDLGAPGPGVGPVLDVFCVPDGQEADFMQFVLDDMPDLLEASGLPFVALVPHSESATREFYPGTCLHPPCEARGRPSVWGEWFVSGFSESAPQAITINLRSVVEGVVIWESMVDPTLEWRLPSAEWSPPKSSGVSIHEATSGRAKAA
jgi:hypothetical protein